MQIIRFFSAAALISATALYSTKLFGVIHLDQMMSTDEMRKTGVYNLTDGQKRELEVWINTKFVVKTAADKVISLQENRFNGSQLLLSNDQLYEIAPADQTETSAWLSPVIVTVEPSNDPVYPWVIYNTVTKTRAKAKAIPFKAAPPIKK